MEYQLINEIIHEPYETHHNIDKTYSKIQQFFTQKLWLNSCISVEFKDGKIYVNNSFHDKFNFDCKTITKYYTSKNFFHQWITMDTLYNSFWFQYYINKYNIPISATILKFFDQFISVKFIKLETCDNNSLILLMTDYNYKLFEQQILNHQRKWQYCPVTTKELISQSNLFTAQKINLIMQKNRIMDELYFPYFMKWKNGEHFTEKKLPELDLLFKMIIRNAIIEYDITNKFVKNLIKSNNAQMCKDEETQINDIIHWSQFPQYNNTQSLALGCLINSLLYGKINKFDRNIQITTPDRIFDFNQMHNYDENHFILNDDLFKAMCHVIWYHNSKQIKNVFKFDAQYWHIRNAIICVVYKDTKYRFGCAEIDTQKKHCSYVIYWVNNRWELLYILGNISTKLLKHSNFTDNMVDEYSKYVKYLFNKIGFLFMKLDKKMNDYKIFYK